MNLLQSLHGRTSPRGQEEHMHRDCWNSKMLHLELKETSTETEHESWQLKGRKIKAVAKRSSGQFLLYLPSTPRSADPVSKKGMSTSNHPPPFHSRTHSRDSNQTCDILMKGSVSFLLGYPQDKLTWHFESEVYPDACTLKTVAGPHCHSAPILDIFTT